MRYFAPFDDKATRWHIGDMRYAPMRALCQHAQDRGTQVRQRCALYAAGARRRCYGVYAAALLTMMPMVNVDAAFEAERAHC